jgi:Xaa-Pro dipeptidase
MMLSAIAAAGDGVNQREVMAAIYDAMFRRGGTYPGFVPLVRSTATLTHEHGTWHDAILRNGDMLFLEFAGCRRRYHAPMGRLVHIGRAEESSAEALKICQEALMAAADVIRPGAIAGNVYGAWQDVLDRHGLASYRRHHCGYATGIGYPPSWSGSGVPVGLRPDSKMELRAGMVFHLMSWLLRSEKGDAFLSDTIVVTEEGCEFLTKTSRDLYIR